MIDYLEIALRALERWEGPAVPQTAILHSEPRPESPRNLPEVRVGSSEPETAKRDTGMGWEDWKARALNRLFQEQGSAGQPGRITAATVRQGERKDDETQEKGGE